MSEKDTSRNATSQESIAEYRYAVHSKGLALWKEKNPVFRANMARQLAEWAAILADMEAEEAQKVTQSGSSKST